MHSNVKCRVNSVHDIWLALGSSVVSRLLVIHAISGCDTISALFGHGKVSVFKKLSKSKVIQPMIDVLESVKASHTDAKLAVSY